MTATRHFIERVAERIGRNICPHLLASNVIKAVAEGREDVARFVCTARNGPVYRVNIADRGDFFVVLSKNRQVAITILPPGFTILRQRKGKKKSKVLKARSE